MKKRCAYKFFDRRKIDHVFIVQTPRKNGPDIFGETIDILAYESLEQALVCTAWFIDEAERENPDVHDYFTDKYFTEGGEPNGNYRWNDRKILKEYGYDIHQVYFDYNSFNILD